MSDVSLSIRASELGRKQPARPLASRAPPRFIAPPPAAPRARVDASTTGRAAMWAEAMQSQAPPPFHATPYQFGGGQAVPGQPPPAATTTTPALTPAAVRAQVKKAATQIIQSKVLTALMVFLITVLLLVCINPPMAQQGVSDDERAAGVRAKRSWKKIMVWSLLICVLALVLPVAAGFLPSTGSGSDASPAA